MLVYIVIIFFGAAAATIEITQINRTQLLKKLTCIFAPLCFFVLWIMAGLRYFTGSDYENYKYIYDNLEQHPHLEKGYYALNNVFSEYLDFQYLLLFISFFAIVFKLYGFKKYTGLFFVPCFIYFCTFFLSWEMGALRMGLAISIVLLGIEHLINRRMIGYFFYVLIGASIHQSVLIYAPLYFILHKNISDKSCVFIILASVGLAFSGLTMFLVEQVINLVSGDGHIAYKIKNYLTTSGDVGFRLTSVLKKVVLLSFFLIIRKKVHRNDYYLFNVFFNLYLLSSLSYLALISVSPEMAGRLAGLFGIAEIFLFALSLKAVNGVKRYLILLLIFISSIGRFIVTTSHFELLFFPYKNVILGTLL